MRWQRRWMIAFDWQSGGSTGGAVIRRKPARPGDQRSTVADTSKLERPLGWQAKISLDQGLERQVAWQRERFPASVSHTFKAA